MGSQVAKQKIVPPSEIVRWNAKHATAIHDRESKRTKLAVLTGWEKRHIVGMCDIMHVEECVLC